MAENKGLLWAQIKAAFRLGAGAKGQSCDGTFTAGHVPKYLSDGTLTDGGVAPGSSVTLQTNGTNNGSQSTLNLVAGSNMSLTDDGSGDVTIASSLGPSGRYNVAIELIGAPAGGSSTLGLFVFTESVNFPSNFSGSVGKVGTNPTGSQSWTLNKNGSSCGTVAISTGGMVAFASSGGASVSFAAGDEITLVGASTADATLANVSLTLAGTRATVTSVPIGVVPGQYVGGPIPASQIVCLYTFSDAITFAANWSGAAGKCGTNPGATTTFTVLKNGSSCGTISISTSGVFTFATSGGAAVTFQSGDEISVTAPSSPDSTLANVAFSFSGNASGFVQLGQDLGGTVTAPKVIGIQGIGVSGTSPTNGQVLEYDSSSGLYIPTTPSTGFTNPMTTAGDLIVGGTSGVPARLAAAASGLVLTSNGPGAAPSYQAAGVPTAISTSPDWPPSSAGSLDDEFTGSVLSASWTKVNWTSASASVANSYLSITPDVGVWKLNLLTKAQPASTPWSIIARLSLPIWATNTWTGLCVYDGTKIISWAIINNTGLRYSKWTSVSANSSDTSESSSGLLFNQAFTYLKITNDGTNLISYYSPNGAFWVQSVSESKTAFLSATTNVGLFLAQSGAGTVMPVFDFFRSTP